MSIQPIAEIGAVEGPIRFSSLVQVRTDSESTTPAPAPPIRHGLLCHRNGGPSLFGHHLGGFGPVGQNFTTESPVTEVEAQPSLLAALGDHNFPFNLTGGQTFNSGHAGSGSSGSGAGGSARGFGSVNGGGHGGSGGFGGGTGSGGFGSGNGGSGGFGSGIGGSRGFGSGNGGSGGQQGSSTSVASAGNGGSGSGNGASGVESESTESRGLLSGPGGLSGNDGLGQGGGLLDHVHEHGIFDDHGNHDHHDGFLDRPILNGWLAQHIRERFPWLDGEHHWPGFDRDPPCDPASAPSPSGIVLLLMGLPGLAISRWRRSRNAKESMLG